MVALVLAQDLPQMVLIPDEDAVQKLAPTSANPASSYRVHAGGFAAMTQTSSAILV
jgi:hypothetical protein